MNCYYSYLKKIFTSSLSSNELFLLLDMLNDVRLISFFDFQDDESVPGELLRIGLAVPPLIVADSVTSIVFFGLDYLENFLKNVSLDF